MRRPDDAARDGGGQHHGPVSLEKGDDLPGHEQAGLAIGGKLGAVRSGVPAPLGEEGSAQRLPIPVGKDIALAGEAEALAVEQGRALELVALFVYPAAEAVGLEALHLLRERP